MFSDVDVVDFVAKAGLSNMVTGQRRSPTLSCKLAYLPQARYIMVFRERVYDKAMMIKRIIYRLILV